MRMGRDLPAGSGETPVWGLWATLLWTAVIGLAFVSVQGAVVGIYIGMLTAGQGELEKQLAYERSITDGDILAWATIISAVLCTAMVLMAAFLKRGARVKDYLGLYVASKKRVLTWTLLFILLLAVMDLITSLLLDRPVTPDVMREVYASADSKLLLFVGIVVAASIFEELFFRGFLLESLRRSIVGPWGAVIVSAALWSLVHVQYDAYGIATIFIIGLFLGLAKLRSGSTLFAILLHALNNGLAFFFLMWLHNAES